MSLATEIAPHLPYLRRFARSLCGSQDSGDAYVVHALEAIIADPADFPSDLDPKIGIYRTFVRVWNSISVNTHGDTPQAASGTLLMDRRLDAITPRPRQAFLLVAVEGFKKEQAAQILDCTDAELASLIDEAGKEIAAQVATDVLIIEDEPSLHGPRSFGRRLRPSCLPRRAHAQGSTGGCAQNASWHDPGRYPARRWKLGT